MRREAFETDWMAKAVAEPLAALQINAMLPAPGGHGPHLIPRRRAETIGQHDRGLSTIPQEHDSDWTR